MHTVDMLASEADMKLSQKNSIGCVILDAFV